MCRTFTFAAPGAKHQKQQTRTPKRAHQQPQETDLSNLQHLLGEHQKQQTNQYTD
jgi:hypothetical protein